MNPRYFRKLFAPVALAAALAALTPATAAATSVPAPGYERFTGCPHPGQNPSVTNCFRSVISAEHLQMGNVVVVISKAMTLSGGVTSAGTFDFNSFGGLQKVEQKVPGGVVGLTGLTWLNGVLSPSELTLFAVIELAGIPSNPLVEPVKLPIRVRMVNPVLGNNCYIGSVAQPITLSLTTTSPGVYVDNTFSAPGAQGCVLTLFGYIPISINGVINAQSGLPSPTFNNSTTLVTKTETAGVELVYP